MHIDAARARGARGLDEEDGVRGVPLLILRTSTNILVSETLSRSLLS